MEQKSVVVVNGPVILEGGDNLNELWDQWEGEPTRWFLRFQRYYLYRGLVRSVRSAYKMFLAEHYPENHRDMFSVLRGYGPWTRMAKKWSWVARAEAWDRLQNDLVYQSVEEARRLIQSNAVAAAEALIAALVNPRLTVAAANSLLDRANIPATARRENVNKNLTLTVEDLEKAKREAQQWETDKYKKNG